MSTFPEELDWRRLPNAYLRKTAIIGSTSVVDCGFAPGGQDFEITCDMEFSGGALYDPIMTTPYYNETTNVTRILRIAYDGCIVNADSSPAGSSSLSGFYGRHIMAFGRRNGNRYGRRDFTFGALSNNSDAQTPQPQGDTLRLFGSVGGMLTTIYRFYAKLNGDCVCDLIPCVRLHDGCPGFYDFARNMFLTSLDGGTSLQVLD